VGAKNYSPPGEVGAKDYSPPGEVGAKNYSPLERWELRTIALLEK